MPTPQRVEAFRSRLLPSRGRSTDCHKTEKTLDRSLLFAATTRFPLVLEEGHFDNTDLKQGSSFLIRKKVFIRCDGHGWGWRASSLLPWRSNTRREAERFLNQTFVVRVEVKGRKVETWKLVHPEEGVRLASTRIMYRVTLVPRDPRLNKVYFPGEWMGNEGVSSMFEGEHSVFERRHVPPSGVPIADHNMSAWVVKPSFAAEIQSHNTAAFPPIVVSAIVRATH